MVTHTKNELKNEFISRWGPSVQEEEHRGDDLAAGGDGIAEQSREGGGKDKTKGAILSHAQQHLFGLFRTDIIDLHPENKVYCCALQRTPAEEITFETLKNAIGTIQLFYFFSIINNIVA